MSDDILAQVAEELRPKSTKEAVIALAAEVRYIRRLQEKQNGKVDKNCYRLTRLEVLIGTVPIAAAIITKASGTWPWA